jgi:hypothetical protein
MEKLSDNRRHRQSTTKAATHDNPQSSPDNRHSTTNYKRQTPTDKTDNQHQHPTHNNRLGGSKNHFVGVGASYSPSPDRSKSICNNPSSATTADCDNHFYLLTDANNVDWSDLSSSRGFPPSFAYVDVKCKQS